MAFNVRQSLNKPLAVASRRKLLTTLSVAVTFLLLPIVFHIMDPVLIIAKYNTRVAYDSPIHQLLKKELEAVHISAYLFNVTNAKRFLAGDDEKLKVEEVGPFTYRELRTHEDLELDLEAGVIRYTPKINPVFILEESIGDPKNVSVTLPNIALLSMTSMMSTYPYLSRLGFNMLANQLDSQALVTMDAHHYLWGYDEPLITAGNTFLPGWISFDTMGLMDRLYDKNVQYRLEVGATNADKFKVKAMNGFAGLRAWGYDDPDKRTKCNSFVDAYEGIGYPTGITPDTPIRIYRNVLCRMLELDFHGHRTLDYGPEALVFRISNRTYSNNPDKECTCGDGTCIEGVSDLSPCFYNLPLAMSNAHFLYGGPELFERIEGLKPNEKDHGSEFLIEPKIGAVLTTSFSIQVNIVVKDVSYNSQTQRFSNMVLPIGYFKIIQPELPEQNKADLHKLYVTGPYLVLGMQAACTITGVSLLGYCIRLLYWNWLCSEDRGIAFQRPEDGKDPMILDTGLPLIKSHW